MDNKIEIVYASPDDANAIGEIQTQTWLESYPNPEKGITREDIEAQIKDWDLAGDERIKAEIQKNGAYTWVAKDGDKVVGFIGVLKEEDENKIEALHVLPEYQGQGIGTKLLETALALLGNSKKISIDVVSYNTSALNLYKKFGFKRQGKVSDDPIILPSGKSIPKILMIRRIE